VALQRDGGGTRLRNTVDAGADSLITALMFLAMWPMFRFGMKRGIRQDLKRLKAALEEETT